MGQVRIKRKKAKEEEREREKKKWRRRVFGYVYTSVGSYTRAGKGETKRG